MSDPTNWNPEGGSFEFKSPEEAKRAEVIINRMMRESFENGRNVGLEEAATVCDTRQDEGHDDGIGPAMCAKSIRALKRTDAANATSTKENK